MADHRHIRFDLISNSELQKVSFNPRRTNWSEYCNILASRADALTTTILSIGDVEVAARQLNETLITSFEESTSTSSKRQVRNTPWWNDELAKMRKKVRKLFNKAGRTNRWEAYRAALTDYNNHLRRSKRSAWRRFCESVEETPEAARLQKVLSKEHSNGVGLLRKPDGVLTKNRSDTLEHLLQTHFPGSILSERTRDQTPNCVLNISRANSLSGVIFTPDKVRWAVHSFKPFKSPGGDGIFPILLQKGMEYIEECVIALFRASFTWSYIPEPWRRVNVVFIPKMGNKPCDSAKSYRPISLTSFLLKSMEKLIDIYIREQIALYAPLHEYQFAYIKGKSTELALHHLTSKVEKAMDIGNIALGAFLDIEGAFDNTGYDSISNALRNKNVDTSVNSWIRAMLESREITATSGDTSVSVTAVKGCPQGGVVSPLLWSLVVDDLLTLLCDNGYYAIGYADDIAVVVTGKFESTIQEVMASALALIKEWCVNTGLSVNPNKTILVPFTRKYKVNLTPIIMEGTSIPYSGEVKYLGVILDKKLNWNRHLDTVISRAIKALWTCRGYCGKTWGLNPKMLYFIYTSMVRPIVTYASVVWWPKLMQKTSIDKCCKLQRLACLSITGAMRTSPTAAMEAIVGLTPLHLHIIQRAATSEVKIQIMYGQNQPVQRNHMAITDDIPNRSQFGTISDVMVRKFNFGRRFEVEIPDRAAWSGIHEHRNPNSLIWYTDGSKIEKGLTGIGIYGPNTSISESLGTWPTVFQAEIIAITKCADIIINKTPKGMRIIIYSDSQAAIKALGSCQMDSKLVQECFNTLQKLSVRNKVTICWVPGHSGIEGNEKADELARLGSSTQMLGPEPFCGISWSTVKSEISSWITVLRKQYWDNHVGLRQSKNLINPYLLGDTCKLSRTDLRGLFGFLTGHYPVRYHLNKMTLSDETICRLCLEEDETTEHILCECGALVRIRREVLSREVLQSNEI